MFEPHHSLSSEEKNIDDELMEVRASNASRQLANSSSQAKCDRVDNSQWSTCGKYKPMETESESLCCQNRECERKSFTL